jgi:signal transduction histidine kinase
MAAAEGNRSLDLKLVHKGLLLVSVLLGLELAFFGGLAALLNQAEQEAAREAHAKLIAAKTNGLIQNFYDVANVTANYITTRSEEADKQYSALLNAIQEQIGWLKTAMKGDRTESVIMTRVEKSANKGLAILARVKSAVETLPKVEAFPVVMRAKDDLQAVSDALVPDLHKLLSLEKKIEEESPAGQARSRRLAVELMYFGVLCNIILAVILAIYFVQNITRRVAILTDNSRRLALGQPLHPPLGGGDEVGHLDKVFHEMSEALAEAARKERAFTESLKASEERIRLIIESMPVGLIKIDRQGVIEFTNPRTHELFGYEPAELLGKHIMLLFGGTTESSEDSGTAKDESSADSAKSESSVGAGTASPGRQCRPLQSSTTQQFMDEIYPGCVGHIKELEAVKKNGEKFPTEFSLSELTTTSTTSFLAIVLDVTERHQIQKLRQAFVAMVTHELRTPLTSVQAYLTLLELGALGDLSGEAKDGLVVADRNIAHVVRLINDLLDIEKMQDGRLTMNFVEVQISSILKRARDAVAGLAEKNGVSLVVSETELTLMADGDRLAQVLINLLSNAVKFSPSGSAIKVEVLAQPDWVELRVIDRGRGIPPAYRDIVFERFQQVEAADATIKGGTGLGLAICKTIVEQHSGKIGVESEEGMGSTFWFRLPRDKGHIIELDQPAKTRVDAT